MNVKELRKLDLYKIWIDLSKEDIFNYPDQDILNKTCDGKILYVPMRYNYMPGAGGRFEKPIKAGIYTEQEYKQALINPAIVHYILRQPWKNRENILGDFWWKYAYMTPFYAYFRSKIDHEPDLIKKDVLLFNCIKLMTIKVRQTKVKYYLFGFIPLFLVKIPDRF
jgi:lipopolysaccharide biosynthesis glycosyltransferase